MAKLKILLLTSMLIATVVLLVTSVGSEPCTNIATRFLTKMMRGDTDSVVPLFAENSCHCQPRGGFIAYLRYESGENDNLSFLFGHHFKTGSLTARIVPTVEKVKTPHLLWETPESAEVDIPLIFNSADYSPYFLPLDSAYGHSVKEADLIAFCKDPSPDFWKALSLRLRPTLAKGLVAQAAAKTPRGEPEFMADLFKELLTGEDAKYLKPADAADIIGADGKNRPATEFAAMLPRLKAGILRLYVGRRGKFLGWSVRKGRLKDPVFELASGKELKLKTPDSALVDIHGPAVQPARM
jgi:hypothetical protein